MCHVQPGPSSPMRMTMTRTSLLQTKKVQDLIISKKDLTCWEGPGPWCQVCLSLFLESQDPWRKLLIYIFSIDDEYLIKFNTGLRLFWSPCWISGRSVGSFLFFLQFQPGSENIRIWWTLLAPKVLLDYLRPMITCHPNPIQPIPTHKASYNDLQWPLITYFWQFLVISGYFWLFPAIFGYFRLFLTITDYF